MVSALDPAATFMNFGFASPDDASRFVQLLEPLGVGEGKPITFVLQDKKRVKVRTWRAVQVAELYATACNAGH